MRLSPLCVWELEARGNTPLLPRENKFVHMEMICIEEQASVVFVKEKGGHHYIYHILLHSSSEINHCHRREEDNARIAILE